MRTPWGGMMRAAAMLGVGPQAFWRLSLPEWRVLTDRPAEVRPMDRRAFERMTEAWPDD